MVCTVTEFTTTVIGMGAPFGITLAITVIVFLATRVLANAYGGSKPNLLLRYLDIAIIPLLFVFALRMIIITIKVPVG